MLRVVSYPSVMQAEIIMGINRTMEKLRGLSDEELTRRARKGYAYMEERERSGALDRGWDLLFAGSIFYEGAAAGNILAERHGEEYVMRMFGYRKPVTLKEKVVAAVTGSLPRA